MQNHQDRASAVAAILVVAIVAGCSSARPEYAPGYSAVAHSVDRYRVSFSGSRSVSRYEVELSLLQRAAELTLQSGYSHFTFYTRDGDTSLLGPFYYSYDPYTPFHGGRWSNYPWGETLRPATSYSVFTEIEMLRAGQAAGNPQAMDALATLRRLSQPPLPIALAAGS
jgi:hypothetical protein